MNQSEMSLQTYLFDTRVPTAIGDAVVLPAGLTYAPQFVAVREQSELLEIIDALPWRDDLKRRVQHYGYIYDYKSRRIGPSMYLGPLPPFAEELGRRLVERGLLLEPPDQMIVNEYQPGQGITAHVDCVPCFNDRIATISLGSACEMDFIHSESGESKSIWLEPGSALLISGEARYQWQHRIAARKSDRGLPRSRRVSLTFRKVILEAANCSALVRLP